MTTLQSIARKSLPPSARRRASVCWLVPLTLAALCAAAVTAHATVVLPADFVEMVTDSQLIVHGRVADVRAQTTGEQGIESMVTVTVMQSLKGEAGAMIVFRVPNGQIGRYRRVTVGAPEFRPGDEIVVFLRGRAPVVPMPYGLNQGVYRVQRMAGGRALVAPAPVLSRAGDAERLVRRDPAGRPVAIEAFIGQVHAIETGASPAGAVARPSGRGIAVPRTGDGAGSAAGERRR